MEAVGSEGLFQHRGVCLEELLYLYALGPDIGLYGTVLYGESDDKLAQVLGVELHPHLAAVLLYRDIDAGVEPLLELCESLFRLNGPGRGRDDHGLAELYANSRGHRPVLMRAVVIGGAAVALKAALMVSGELFNGVSLNGAALGRPGLGGLKPFSTGEHRRGGA